MATDVFISYAREDRESAHQLADALQAQRLRVWWDRELIGGGDFATEIERRLAEARVVIVLWSEASVASGFVRDESSRARDLGKLLPVRIGPVALPLGFGTLHTLDLLDWDGDTDALQDIVAQIRARLAHGKGPDPSPQPLPPGPWWQRLLRRRTMLLTAGAGAAAVVGGPLWRRDSLRRQDRQEARDRLERGLQFQFGHPPQFESARSAYLDALGLDPGLARAHYFLAHLYVQLMLAADAAPQGEVLQALREDADRQFGEALRLAQRDDRQLDGSQRVIAHQQQALLQQRDEAEPLAQQTESAAAAPVVAPAAAPPVAGASASAAVVAGTALPAPASASAPVVAAAASAAARRIEPPQELAQQVRARALALFDADRDARLAASAALTLDPALAAEALPFALSQAATALQRGASDEASRQGVAATLALLRRALPGTLRANRVVLHDELLPALAQAADPAPRAAVAPLREALARSERRRPVVYLQIAEPHQRPIAEALQRRLIDAGYSVPGIEETGPARAPEQPSLRSQGGSDPALARWCRKVLAEVTATPSARLSTLRHARPDNDTYEIWFDAGLCARVAGCSR